MAVRLCGCVDLKARGSILYEETTNEKWLWFVSFCCSCLLDLFFVIQRRIQAGPSSKLYIIYLYFR